MEELEKKLKRIGFQKLQEKEQYIFFEQSKMKNKAVFEQICIVYDKNENKIKMDTFIIQNEKMTMAPNDQTLSQNVFSLVSS